MTPVTVVELNDVEPVELPRGSWSRMVLNSRSLSGNASSLGYSIFTPGCVTAMVCHETEEVAYVLSGTGELRLDPPTPGTAAEAVPFAGGQGLFIPAGIWHAVANTGTQDVAMVFGFPHPDYPPTQRRET
jgi:oxalate decarboxylase/phosphoglucose isomerase-like protein (cupin superfamily)